ncbi:MAG: insulinase family protein [Bacteroidales bacterium]|jgi:predicted Zn-dependent peptidase|nr:insulinase family protein [Bacteroidales bacterium]
MITRKFKNKVKNLLFIGFIFSALAGSLFAQGNYKYETVPNDPLKARIYTLDNGLKVYMSVYKNEPKIKITIATKAGSKLDPAETTGLAHYFEHLMFKGTKQFGTTNYAAEEPLLNEIERLFEEYRKIDESQDAERKAIFKQIDSVSQLASKIAIPNEYDKLMSIIGAEGTNAGTWIDFTNYYETIPSNQLESFFIIQADRFQNPVLRLFHTELETIYEEKNMTLTKDARRVSTALMEGLFPNHPYGTQTTIGTQQNLRNPSITNVKKFFDTYYVPNNMAIVMSGDFDPDEAIAIIDKYMGKMQSKPLPVFTFTPEKPITEPIIKEVVGKEAESVQIAWRFGNPNTPQIPVLTLAEMILTNGHAGLVDLNINQKQRALGAGSGVACLHDYSYMLMYGSPKSGQTLEELKDILLEQIDKLAAGDFPDWLMEACINDLKQRKMNEIESNAGREALLTQSFYLDIPWADNVNEFDVMSKITKQQIVDFAKQYLRRDNYVIVYKRKGTPTDIDKVKKPKVTPLKINREDKSDFVKMIEGRQVKPIEPVFLDFNKDIQTSELSDTKGNKGIYYYTQNADNELFDLSYVYEIGTEQDKYLNIAANYLVYLGTDKYTPEQIKEELYKLGCTFNMSARGDRSYVTLSGLAKNMPQVVALLEDIVKNAQPNKEALDNLVSDVLKSRTNIKGNQNAIASRLVQYGWYGVVNPILATQLSEKELKALTPEFLINKLQEWFQYKHYVIYYAPTNNLKEAFNSHVWGTKETPAQVSIYKEDVPKKDRIYVVHFDSPQMVVYGISFSGNFDKNLMAVNEVYNNYFGGSMNAIVFQELREARALAYTAFASFSQASKLNRLNYNISYIGCGNDKVSQSMSAFRDLYANMPENDASFVIARNASLESIRTERITKDDKVWKYLAWKRLGLTEDPRKAEFETLPSITFNDIKRFQQEQIVGKPITYMIVGDTKSIDMKYLKKIGKVTKLSLEQIFGF